MPEPETKLRLPKFLTKGVAEEAVNAVTRTLFQTGFSRFFEREMCHIVLLVRATRGPLENYPFYSVVPHILYERSVGKKNWPYPFDEIAQGKAIQLWDDRNDERTDITPHLLVAGDTPFWGGVKREGIVVACSGVKPWHDRMISGMIADMCIGMAYHAWMTSEDKKATDDDACFLT